MKKKLYIIFVLILFSFTFDVLAFTGDYNYEVKNLSRNGNIINIVIYLLSNFLIFKSEIINDRIRKIATNTYPIVAVEPTTFITLNFWTNSILVKSIINIKQNKIDKSAINNFFMFFLIFS